MDGDEQFAEMLGLLAELPSDKAYEILLRVIKEIGGLSAFKEWAARNPADAGKLPIDWQTKLKERG